MNIKVINKLQLNSEGVQTQYRNGKPHDFFIRQGDLDGACAPYSVCMISMLLGLVSIKDLDVYNRPDYRTAKGKLIRSFFEKKGLVRDGYQFCQIKEELEILKSRLACAVFSKKKGVLQTIREQIEQDNPILISVDFSNGSHALVAVGLEYNETGSITKILCIDPGFEKPKLTYWNSVIDIEHEYKGKYSWTWTNDNSAISLGEAISFELIY